MQMMTKIVGPVGKIFITISLLFKLSLAPFHMWAPDMCEGVPTITTALLVIIPNRGFYSISTSGFSK